MEPIATLSKDGQTRQAYTQADLVSLKYAGWRVQPSESQAAAEPAPEPAAPVEPAGAPEPAAPVESEEPPA